MTRLQTKFANCLFPYIPSNIVRNGYYETYGNILSKFRIDSQ